MQNSKDVCDANCFILIPGAILCSKFNYSVCNVNENSITLIIFIFLFFIEKILKTGKYTVEMRT